MRDIAESSKPYIVSYSVKYNNLIRKGICLLIISTSCLCLALY